ncbi:hemerythrin domain-containing protein [Hydrogenophaga sp.]|jgi:hemerythrin-like domain-containing protein|uniref:hemerythrin domain-containing protein n=1 Tax=Hydrogenophaga sp. TaxID=1904254 RepID=UPI00271842D6|nr:hemerythrin domain-containing protein [Hydrogenophaga sp.]MBV1733142.1 hemerythrin domain-containing protein [Hydrogenophaga sp.]MDO9252738.1 hemerythrin domain-containing protein [Hydrogenophaga sp.]MDP2405397.1 hemerythrin domain-containing protein [Hydrogenophaga sp.]MDP3325719.1 hemerythrin domain-containing protein [Hydrogenophaga sp.]MDP3883769.1 hemerythrin domain-containing protein [Hydrogenophaga sp.]
MNTPVNTDEPLNNFSDCHAGIVKRLTALDELPALLEPAAKARQIAEESLEFFREAIFEHHLEEERELFPAVIASAQPGAELERVKAMAKRLTDEHRAIEALWKQLEKGLKPVAKGQSTRLDVSELHRLVTEYKAHAAYEETEFLPLSEEILGRNSNHMAALGLSLHMRHAKPVNAYI